VSSVLNSEKRIQEYLRTADTLAVSSKEESRSRTFQRWKRLPIPNSRAANRLVARLLGRKSFPGHSLVETIFRQQSSDSQLQVMGA